MRNLIIAALMVIGTMSCSGPTETTRVASISVTAPSTTISSGATIRLAAIARDSKGNVLQNQPITWESTNKTIADVDNAGNVTAKTVLGKDQESATITARIGQVSASVSISVLPAEVDKVLITLPDSAQIGSTVEVTVQTLDAQNNQLIGRSVELTTSDSTVLALIGQTSAKPLKVGTASITARSNGKTATKTVRTVFVATQVLAIQNLQLSTYCVIVPSGKVYCWGYNADGQLGNGTTQNSETPTEVLLPDGVSIRRIASTGNGVCGLSTANQVFCWGRVWKGDGTALATVLKPQVPAKIPNGEQILEISAYCLLTTTGKVFCWGFNQLGEVGLGYSSDPVLEPTQIAQPNISFVRLGQLKDNIRCAITAGNETYCWGYNEYGFGDGTAGQKGKPPTKLTQAFQTISTGNTTCGIADSGAVYCFGYNSRGQVGVGDTFNRSTPAKTLTPDGIQFQNVYSNSNASCALSTTLSMYCWGGNDGEFGTSSNWGSRNPPTEIALNLGVKIKELSIGQFGACGLGVNGGVYCWGSLRFGAPFVPPARKQVP